MNVAQNQMSNKPIHSFIQAFLGHPLLWHYCIHLPDSVSTAWSTCTHPHLSGLSSVSTIRDFALPVPIFPPSSIFNHFSPPIPISPPSPAEVSSFCFPPCLLNPQSLFPLVCTGTSALPYPIADLSFLSYVDIFPKNLMESRILL